MIRLDQRFQRKNPVPADCQKIAIRIIPTIYPNNSKSWETGTLQGIETCNIFVLEC